MTRTELAFRTLSPETIKEQQHEIREYYRETTLDYEYWSKNLNMHFGYWKWPLNPLNREGMLEEMNHQVIRRLTSGKAGGRYLDLGCGVGRTVKWAMKHHPEMDIVGYTLCEEQVNWGKGLFGTNHPIKHGNYEELEIEPESLDGVYFLESLCHADDKGKLINKIFTWLKPGGKLIIADGFLMKQPSHAGRWIKACYDTVCEYWAVPDFCDYKETLRDIYHSGLSIEDIEEPSFRVGVSALHSPFLVLYCWMMESLKHKKLSRRRRQHLIAVLASVTMGICRGFFRYHILTLKKP
jgi:ubiquinone/menaquinone biosynthesis C-methylase UbiE